MEKTLNFHGKTAKVIIKDPNEHIQKFWAQGIFYEAHRKGLLNYINGCGNYKGGVIIDCGASIGNHTLFFCSVIHAVVLSIEPHKESFEHLVENLKLNGFDESVVNIALGERKRKVSMISKSKNNVGMLQVDENGNDIDMYALDTVVLKNEDLVNTIDNIGLTLVKIDVEHYNEKLLKGAKKVLMKYKPDVFIECETEAELKATISILSEYGYSRVKGLVLNHTPTYLFKANK